MIRTTSFLLLGVCLLATGGDAVNTTAFDADADAGLLLIVEKAPTAPAKPVRSKDDGKAKESAGSSPASAPQKRRRFRRCRLGDFACYEATADVLAALSVRPYRPTVA